MDRPVKKNKVTIVWPSLTSTKIGDWTAYHDFKYDPDPNFIMWIHDPCNQFWDEATGSCQKCNTPVPDEAKMLIELQRLGRKDD